MMWSPPSSPVIAAGAFLGRFWGLGDFFLGCETDNDNISPFFSDLDGIYPSNTTRVASYFPSA